MKTQIILPVLYVAVGSVVGFILGKSVLTDNSNDEPVADVKSFSYRSSSATTRKREVSGESPVRVRSLKEALGKQTQTGRLEALMDYFSTLNPSSFSEEADKLSELPMSERLISSLLLFSHWGESDPLTAMSYTKTMGRIGGFVNGTVLKSWASSNPADAAKYYTENTDDFNTVRRGGRGQSRASVVASEWAAQDKEAALAWAQDLEGGESSSAVEGVFNQIASNDPVEAALLLASVDDLDTRINAQNTVARQWGGDDWSAAEAWVLTLPIDQQDEAMAAALRGLSDTNYLAAAEKLAALTDTEGFSDTMGSITRDWSRDDPAAASEWIMTNGTTDAQRESIGIAIASWVNVDQAAAYNFVNQQEAGEVRDEAIVSYIASNRNGDTNENLDLAESVTDTLDRARAISQSISGWMQDDEAAATAYVNESALLTDEQKQRVLQRAGEGGGGRRRR